MNPHVIKQIIKYSDGTETVINYRGVIGTDGVLTPTVIEDEQIVDAPVAPEPVEAEVVEEVVAEPVAEEVQAD